MKKIVFIFLLFWSTLCHSNDLIFEDFYHVKVIILSHSQNLYIENELDYEKLKFDSNVIDIQENNWPDYRLKKIGEPNKKNQFMSSWCHGAPGIGLSRACLWGTALWDEQCVEEISIALEIIAKTQSINDQLCCGNFGLITIAEALAKGPWPLDAALRQTSLEFTKNRKANLIQAKGLKPETWTCFGTTKNSLTFTGFYTGISGIGMAMLEDSASSKATLSLMTSGLWPEIL